MPSYVIAGGGLAAAKAAETLRDEGFDGDIVLIGTEPAVYASIDGGDSVPLLVDTGSGGLVVPSTLLGDDYPFFAAHFGVEENGNVPAQLDPQREFVGKNILAQRRSLAESAKAFSLGPEQANDRLLAALAKVRAARAQRPRPHLDDKILTANNGLMISALAKGHQVLGLQDGLRRHLPADDGAEHAFRDGVARIIRGAWHARSVRPG